MPIPAHDPRPLGVFDSGLGGLTVVAALRRFLPDEPVIYLGDNARVPYGNRSPETIREFAAQDLAFLRARGVKAVLAACNTVSSVALDFMRADAPDLPIFGMIEPGVEAALAFGCRRAAVIGTRATIASGAYARALRRRDAALTVDSVACPLLVPLAEEGITEGPLAEQVFDLYLAGFRADPPDVLLLGCTHYPLFKRALEEYLPQTRIIDSAEVCAGYLRRRLDSLGLTAPSAGRGGAPATFCVTDLSPCFDRQAGRFLGVDLRVEAEKVELGELTVKMNESL